ncbi:MAG: amino acid ABC transporter permease, partial [Candidatus Adiutrix sp.]
ISVVAIGDMFRVAREHASVTFEYFETYTTIALIYLIITLILSKCVSLMEARLSYYDKH